MSTSRFLLAFAALVLASASSGAFALYSGDPWGWTGTAYHNAGSLVENGSRDEFVSYTGTLALTGSVIEGVDRITVAWDGDEKGGEYALSKFRKGDAYYRYNISPGLRNIREGKNAYTVRQYAGQEVVCLWIADVEFRDPSKKGNFPVKRVDAVLYEWSTNFMPTSELADRYAAPFYFEAQDLPLESEEAPSPDLRATYWLAFDTKFGDYVLDLGGGYSMVYTAYSDEDDSGKPLWKAKFKIVHTSTDGAQTRTNDIEDVDFSLGDFNFPSIRLYAGDYLIVSTGAGHEGVAREFLFDPVRMKLSDIYADLEKSTLAYRAYPIFRSSIRNGKLSLEEMAYCCDRVYNPGGHERIVYDLASMKLVSRKRLDPIDVLAITDRKGEKLSLVSDFEGGPIVSLSPEDYGFSLSRGDKAYKILNIGFVTEFYKGYEFWSEPMDMDEVTGRVYGGEYVIIKSMKPHTYQ